MLPSRENRQFVLDISRILAAAAMGILLVLPQLLAPPSESLSQMLRQNSQRQIASATLHADDSTIDVKLRSGKTYRAAVPRQTQSSLISQLGNTATVNIDNHLAWWSLTELMLLLMALGLYSLWPLLPASLRKKTPFYRPPLVVGGTWDKANARIAAAHEAGHALLAHFCGFQVTGVNIIPGSSEGGSTSYTSTVGIVTRESLMQQLTVGMAGTAAEEILLGEVTAGGSGDISFVTRQALQAVCQGGIDFRQFVDVDGWMHHPRAAEIDRAVQAIIDAAYQEALRLLQNSKGVLEGMRDVLMERKSLTGPEFREALQQLAANTAAAMEMAITTPPAQPEA